MKNTINCLPHPKNKPHIPVFMNKNTKRNTFYCPHCIHHYGVSSNIEYDNVADTSTITLPLLENRKTTINVQLLVRI